MYLISRLAFHNLTQLMECLTYLCYLRHKVTREQSTSSSSSLKETGWLNLILNPIQIGASSDGSAMLTQCQHNVNNPVASKCQNYSDSGKNDVAQISLSDLPGGKTWKIPLCSHDSAPHFAMRPFSHTATSTVNYCFNIFLVIIWVTKCLLMYTT